MEKEKYYKTHPDMDDGFGGSTPACREYSRPRQEAGQTVLGVIPEGTVIGPAQQFIVVKIMGTSGVEIEILSPSNPEQNFWVMLRRGMNRYMDEAPVPKSEYNNASTELITEKAVETTEPCCTEWDNLALRKLVSKEAIVVKNQCAARNAQLPPVGESEKLLLNLQDPIPDGAVHWDSVHSRLLKNLVAEWDKTAHKEIGFKQFTKEATRRGSNIARIPKIM